MGAVRFPNIIQALVLYETIVFDSILLGSHFDVELALDLLMDAQHGRCFYCRRALTAATTHVDHFLPCARYPVDFGHNFVLANNRCNSQKRDRLPAYKHLAAWVERNAANGDQIADALKEFGIAADLAVSNRVTQWAYAQTEVAGGLTWLSGDKMVPLTEDWRSLFGS